MKSILDPSFRYVPSAATDIKKTFARLRLEQRRDAERRASGTLVDDDESLRSDPMPRSRSGRAAAPPSLR